MSKLANQLYGWNRYPPKKELENYYQTETLDQIAARYKTTKTRVRKWFSILEIPKRPRGLGPKGPNHLIFGKHITKQLLENLLKQDPSREFLIEKIGCSSGTVGAYLRKYNLKVKGYYNHKNFITFKTYKRRVRWLTEQNYANYYEKINPNHFPRTKAGVMGGYHLDHIRSIFKSYLKKIPVEECASLSNLQMLSWEDNCKKWAKQ